MVLSGVISKVTISITHIQGDSIAPLIITPEPPLHTSTSLGDLELHLFNY